MRIACTHMHIASHATDTLTITFGANSSMSHTGSISLITSAGISSFLKSMSSFLNLSGPKSLSIFWLGPQ